MAAEALSRERIERVVREMPALCGENSTSQAADAGGEKANEISWKDLIADYFRVMEIAHYLRRGGVKAMRYRIETGRTQCAPNDYFDEAAEELCEAVRSGELPEKHGQSVLERLASVSEQEEAVIREYLPRIDEILLWKRRKESALLEDNC